MAKEKLDLSRQNKRKWYFRLLKKMMKGRYKMPKFIYLGEEITNSSIILSNHVGTEAPMSLELYLNAPIRMWGAHEMNSGLIKLYKYQTRVYYHQRKHWNLHLARLFCLIASPLTNLFYSGLDLISTYRDARVIKTIRESTRALEQGQNIVIFPEDATKGYMDELEAFYSGFVMLAETMLKRGKDLDIFVTYFRQKDMVYIIDKPVKYSTIKQGRDRKEIAKLLCDRCNELGKMEFEETKNADTPLLENKQDIA